jgi:HEAT repeat protein
VDRVVRAGPERLKEALRSPEEEIRRAAAAATVRLAERARLPELLGLLDDPEPAVVQAARAALKDFTGEDFGPRPDATRSDRVLARAAWYGWWLKQQQKKD